MKIWGLIYFFSTLLMAHPPAARKHTVLQSKSLKMIAANQLPAVVSQVQIFEKKGHLYIKSNGIPSHSIGNFPNSGNPNSLSPQSYNFKVTTKPLKNKTETWPPLGFDFGVAVNGVPFDPIAAEWYQGDRNSEWQYNALSGAIALGVDENHAHVQPTGAYHYHGLPVKLLQSLGVRSGTPSVLIGYAADGFKIYALYGDKGVEMTSSYRLKNGSRPIGGTYDGTFVSDYEYVKGSGTLDRCNGTYFNGEYAYFLTKKFPVIPRCFYGTPDQSFKRAPQDNGPEISQKRVLSKKDGPPKAAMLACQNKKPGDSCSFQTPHGNLNGTCFNPPGISTTACRPLHHRR